MKKFIFLIAILACGTAGGAAASPQINWGLLWSGSWEEDTSALGEPMLAGTLQNRGELRLRFLPQNKKTNGFSPDFLLRCQVLDRHDMKIEFNPFLFNAPEKGITHYMGGLYHRQTGSRLLYGVLDEWGLSARIRNPWIRSPPYAENHKPLMADLKTSTSSVKEDEIYLYLSSPYFALPSNIKLRGFFSAQTEADEIKPAFSGGVELVFGKKSNLLLETFYTGNTLSASKIKSWFSYPPPLPEREFDLYAAGIIFTNPFIAVSSDFAYSQVFAWGEDFYGNLGVSITPLLPFGSRARPLSVSLAADGSGERFVNRDGANLSEGFRVAAKAEWKDKYNMLIRLNSVLRSSGFGGEFNRSSSGFYFRFPSSAASRRFPLRFTRLSLSADRNAVNPQKITDNFSGTIGLSVNLQQLKIKNPFGIVFSGSIKGLSASEGIVSAYPILNESWNWTESGVNCELSWAPNTKIPQNLQFKSKFGVSFFSEKDEKWDFSLSAAARFKYGRLSLKFASPDFPGLWNWTVSWRVEKKEK